jgi:ribosome-binding protein aMBF1 (putative translation factor)
MSAHESGKWKAHTFAWWESIDIYCELCGRPLPGRAWIAVVQGVERRFCDPDCAELFRTHRIAG